MSAISLALKICASISFVSSLGVIVLCMLLKRLRESFSFNIFSFIALNDCALAIVHLMSNSTRHSPQGGFACQFQAFGVGYFGLCSMLWTCAGAHATYRVLQSAISMQSTRERKSLMKLFIPLCQGFPLLPAVLPFFFTDAYGWAGMWCWVHASDSMISVRILRALSFYMWAWAAVFYCLWTYSRIFGLVKVLTRVDSDEMSNANNPLAIYLTLRPQPVVLALVVLFGSLNRIWQAFEESPHILVLLQTISMGLLGFFDGLIFVRNPIVKREVMFHIWTKGAFIISSQADCARSEMLMPESSKDDTAKVQNNISLRSSMGSLIFGRSIGNLPSHGGKSILSGDSKSVEAHDRMLEEKLSSPMDMSQPAPRVFL
mmetsp:Transcript_28195/g.45389  ORF Transcript_28195/g.45389 Transcript_28195/m.45389 type:complete len:373 (+) Transcript_28195:71-1189(+)